MQGRKVLITDDHPLFRTALRQAVKRVAPDAEIFEVSSLAESHNILSSEPDINLLLLDIHMSDSSGFSGLVMICKEFPSLPVIVVSASEELKIMQKSIKYGASGFIPKSSDLSVIREAINSVFNGDQWLPIGIAEKIIEFSDQEEEVAQRFASLTPAQFKVLIGITEGLLNKQIAYNMDISEATVKAHVTAIFKKLNVSTRTQAVIFSRFLNFQTEKIEEE